MTSIHTTRNQYFGINAHLHSLLQTQGGWDSFHANHIIDLTRALQVQLRPLGYEADVEQSLQIRVGEYAPYPDNDYRAIVVYRANRQERGDPVVWLELLSPLNKPPAFDFHTYREKRTLMLRSGLVFIEIDYLHQSPPTFPRIASYRPTGKSKQPKAGSHPYRIAVIDPRPVFIEGQGIIRQFDVDEPIPTMSIPLSNDDRIDFNFDTPYQTSFSAMFYGDRIDYRQLPVNFSLYSDADKARIVSRMLAVLTARQAGENLEGAPVPVKTVDLDEGLMRLKAFQDGA